ncbi:MAG: hypothetical protein RUMPE_00184 [Eubacteriales bacterium SKADARSKE-1]|nr:hypothetical protein [Eubacteriales bacterium SKADARSKE-1]
MRYDKSNNSESNYILLLKSLVFGMFLGGLSSILLLVLFALVFTQIGAMPSFVIQTMAIISVSIGTFVSSYITLRIYKSKGLLYGSFAGLLMFLLFTLIGFIISRDHFTIVTLIKFISMLFMGAVGGILGVNSQKR